MKQMWQVFQMTRRYDSSAQWLMLLGFLVPVLIGLGLALWLGEGNGFTIALWIVAGVLAGLLLALVILGRRAERAAYAQIDGQPGAVALISEGPVTRTKRMLDEEQRKVSRILPNVPVTLISVGHDDGSIELYRLPATLRKAKRTLTKPEVLAVSNRLNSLQTALPIPKGIDPMKARPQRGKMR